MEMQYLICEQLLDCLAGILQLKETGIMEINGAAMFWFISFRIRDWTKVGTQLRKPEEAGLI